MGGISVEKGQRTVSKQIQDLEVQRQEKTIDGLLGFGTVGWETSEVGQMKERAGGHKIPRDEKEKETQSDSS